MGRDWVTLENRRTKYLTSLRQMECVGFKRSDGSLIDTFRSSGISSDHAFKLLRLYASMRGKDYKESGGSLPQDFFVEDTCGGNCFSFRGIDLAPGERSRLVQLDVELELSR